MRDSTAAVRAATVAAGDIWEYHARGAWAVIPTNTQRRRDGTAVMGAGLARSAADRFAGLDARYGAQLAAGRTCVAFGAERLLLVPTKRHWRDPSTWELFDAAAAALERWLAARPEPVTVAVPLLGAGLGGLPRDEVTAKLVERLSGTAHTVTILIDR